MSRDVRHGGQAKPIFKRPSTEYMENTIIQESSHGSPMLAYGSSALSPKRKIMIFSSVVILLFAIPVLIISAIFFFGSANLPSQTLLSISLTPSKINAKINGALITELPSPWRTALETNTSFPVIIGLAKNTNGGVSPFAIIPKTISISAPEHTKIIRSGLLKIILTDSIETKKLPYRTLSKTLGSRNKADAGWMVNEQLLQLISNQPLINSEKSNLIYGSVTGNRGLIFLPSENIEGNSGSGAFFVILGKQDTQATTLSNALLTQGINLKTVRSPDQLNVTGDGFVQARWSEVSNEEQLALDVAKGNSTGTVFILPDNDTVKQILPISSSTSATNELSIPSGWKQSSGEVVSWKSSCPGHIRFSVNGEALQNLLILLRTTPSWREKIHSFTISSEGERNIFCINE